MPDALEDDLRIAILRLSRRMRAERASLDVTDGQLSALFVLWKEGPQTLGSLSEHECVTPPSMNRTVNSLVESGLVKRAGSPDDGRKVLITATSAGLEIATETKRRRVAWFARTLATLSDSERELVNTVTPILRKLADS